MPSSPSLVIRRQRYVRALRGRGWTFESRPALESVLDHHAPPFGIGFVRKVDEAVSGTTSSGVPFRVFEYVSAAYERMLTNIEAGKLDAVVVWDLDRLHRRPIELQHFIDLADTHHLALATVSGDTDLGTDSGRLFARIKGAVARSEGERKSARQRRAQLQAAERGLPAGGPRAFGYERDGLTVRESEAKVLRNAYASLLAGRSMVGIARDLDAAGFVTARLGKRFNHSAVGSEQP